MDEKRKSKRIKKPLLLRFNDAAGKLYTLSISDLSQDGICFVSPVLFSPGESIKISLKLPNRPQEWLESSCNVLESKDIARHPGALVTGFRTRVKFDAIPKEMEVALKEYCDFAIKQAQKLELEAEKLLGVWEKKSEKRENIRIHKALVAMYKEVSEPELMDWDFTAIRNISISGAIFTAKTEYKKLAHLQLRLKVPLKPFDWVSFDGRVIESKQLINIDDFVMGGTYLTRIEFFSMSLENKELLEEYIQWFVSYLKNKGLESL